MKVPSITDELARASETLHAYQEAEEHGEHPLMDMLCGCIGAIDHATQRVADLETLIQLNQQLLTLASKRAELSEKLLVRICRKLDLPVDDLIGK